METTPTPERAADPTPEALAAAIAVIARRDAASGPIIQDIARALDSFAQAAVERERERAAGHARKLRKDKGAYGLGHSCGGYCAEIERRIRSGEQP